MHVEGTQAGEGAMAGTAVTGGQSGPPVVAATAADGTTRAIAGCRCGPYADFRALSGVSSPIDLGLLRLPAGQERRHIQLKRAGTKTCTGSSATSSSFGIHADALFREPNLAGHCGCRARRPVRGSVHRIALVRADLLVTEVHQRPRIANTGIVAAQYRAASLPLTSGSRSHA